MKGLRYLAYLAFALAAVVFWVVFYIEVLGFFPFPADPKCGFEPGGCPPPSVWNHLFNVVAIFGTIPVTVIVFVFFRRWVRKKVGLEDEC